MKLQLKPFREFGVLKSVENQMMREHYLGESGLICEADPTNGCTTTLGYKKIAFLKMCVMALKYFIYIF